MLCSPRFLRAEVLIAAICDLFKTMHHDTGYLHSNKCISYMHYTANCINDKVHQYSELNFKEPMVPFTCVVRNVLWWYTVYVLVKISLLSYFSI